MNLSGGGAHNTYNVSLDYYNQKGTLEGAGPTYERYTARVNNTMDTKFIKFHTKMCIRDRANRRQAAYTNLRPGNYTFELRYAPDGKQWLEEMDALAL